MTRARRHETGRTVGPAGLLIAVMAVGGGSLARPVAAQEDFRASDPGRPLRVEDAIPLKLREWEVEFGFRGAAREEESGAGLVAELKTGLFRNAHVGLEIESGVEDEPDAGSVSGIEALHAHALVQLGRETPGLPAVALRAEVATPGTGTLGREGWGGEGVAIGTRSFGRWRVHGNGGYGVLEDADGGDYWTVGLGFDYPLGLFSRAILGAVSAEIPVSEGRSRVWLEAGSRWQLSNSNVLDVGLSTRLDQWEAGNANVELIVGFSRVFGIPWLTRAPVYPNPTIP
ncbi:MAG: hypothetical protein R3195_12980 [Gemmatimonadota bacterium]|nr:hypothetical protein [Gemmatimonadota bacterium]